MTSPCHPVLPAIADDEPPDLVAEVEQGLLRWIGLEPPAEIRAAGSPTCERAGRTQHARDPFRLRQNVYRVLLTRGRDGTVIHVPEGAWFDETYEYLRGAGVRDIVGSPG